MNQYTIKATQIYFLPEYLEHFQCTMNKLKLEKKYNKGLPLFFAPPIF